MRQRQILFLRSLFYYSKDRFQRLIWCLCCIASMFFLLVTLSISSLNQSPTCILYDLCVLNFQVLLAALTLPVQGTSSTQINCMIHVVLLAQRPGWAVHISNLCTLGTSSPMLSQIFWNAVGSLNLSDIWYSSKLLITSGIGNWTLDITSVDKQEHSACLRGY